MDILYISQYFPPEIGATQVRAKENVLQLNDLGHRVTVLTEVPNHPAGVIPAGYRRRWVVREHWHNIPVLRVWVYTRPRKTFPVRMGFYLSFMMLGVVASLIFLRRRFEIIYATSPPFFVGLMGLVLSRWFGAKFVFEIRDLWPRSAIELGELPPGRMARLAERLENYYYRKAALIVAVTRGIYHAISERIGENRLLFLPNGANTRIFRPGSPVSPRLRNRYRGQFIVSYTGVIGLIHGVETVVECARLLQHISDIRFIIIGDGVKKREVKQLAMGYRLENVEFIDAVQEEELVPYILLSDVALATARDLPITRGTLPVKMFSAMACGVPVILSVDGEARELLLEAEAGLYAECENAQALAEAILILYRNRPLARRLGQNGRRYVMAHFDRRRLIQRLTRALLEVQGSCRPG